MTHFTDAAHMDEYYFNLSEVRPVKTDVPYFYDAAHKNLVLKDESNLITDLFTD